MFQLTRPRNVLKLQGVNWRNLQVSPALPILAKLIYIFDDEVLTNVCWAISYLSDGPNEKIEAVIEAGIPRRLVDLLKHDSASVQIPALQSVGNIATGYDAQTQVIINCGALPVLFSLLSSTKESIQKKACWVISFITGGNSNQIQAVIDTNIIPLLINLLSDGDFEIQKNACWAICNATSAGQRRPDQVRHLVSQGCIKPLCDLLACSDNKIIYVTLDGLENILKVGEMDKESGQDKPSVNQYALFIKEAGGVEKVRDCQSNINEEIFMTASKILKQYFSDDDIVDEIENEPAKFQDVFGNDSHIMEPETHH